MNTSLIVANFRDVGQSINVLSGSGVMREGVLYRGGELGMVNDLSTIFWPATIVNLSSGADPEFPGATNLFCPAPDSKDVYLVGSSSNRGWIMDVLNLLVSPRVEAPFYVHCTAGKDRTGVVVGAILSWIGIDRDLVQADYERSSGLLQPELFSEALEIFAGESYFEDACSDRISTILKL